MKKILINDKSWQTRIAITTESKLQHVYFDTHNKEHLERSFFKGVISKVLPGIQTVFVDIGQERSGFLHMSEIDTEFVLERMSLEDGEKAPRRTQVRHVDMNKLFKAGDEILVQVTKEPIYEKGAKLSTSFILPGRFFVLMPKGPKIGISKKIDDEDERIRLRTVIKNYLPQGMGGIIRTTSENAKEKDIIKDINYLLSTWKTIQQGFNKAKKQEKIYQDLDLALQIVRDHLNDAIESIITDSPQMQQRVYSFVKKIAPEYAYIVKRYQGKKPLFDHYKIDQQISDALKKRVELKSGGSLIVESTEAMTVIDVNTGKFIGKKDPEATILQTNLEAAEEITLQLTLRNIGGLIVIDFIDMAHQANRQKLSHFFERMLRERDKFQSVVLKVSEFGLVQMTRKRSGKTLAQELTATCKTCSGLGFLTSIPTMSYRVLRELCYVLAHKEFSNQVLINLNPLVFEYITQNEYNAVLELEKETKRKIVLTGDESLTIEEYKISKA
jgi:ribonuclease G